MNLFPIGRRLRGMLSILVAAAAFALLVPVAPALAAGIDANAKVLAKLDDDWSKAAATRDAERVAAFYAEDAIAYPPNEPMTVGRAAAKKAWAAHFADPSFKISWKAIRDTWNSDSKQARRDHPQPLLREGALGGLDGAGVPRGRRRPAAAVGGPARVHRTQLHAVAPRPGCRCRCSAARISWRVKPAWPSGSWARQRSALPGLSRG
jgi:hypothetical protein